MINLDYLAAKHGQTIGFDTLIEESTINTALSILHEQGIYALFLWCYEKPDERQEIGLSIQRFFKEKDAPIHIPDNKFIWDSNKKRDGLDAVSEVFTLNLKTMFLAKDLIDLMLVYARHAAKARPSQAAAAPEGGGDA